MSAFPIKMCTHTAPATHTDDAGLALPPATISGAVAAKHGNSVGTVKTKYLLKIRISLQRI